MNIRRIILETINNYETVKSELLLESLEERLRLAYEKWVLKLLKKNNYKLIDGILSFYKQGNVPKEHIEKHGIPFPLTSVKPNTEEKNHIKKLYDNGDYELIHDFLAKIQMKNSPHFEKNFNSWLSYRNQMKSSDIFQYKTYSEFEKELVVGKEKSFTKSIKKATKGLDYDKIWESEDMMVVVPKTHIGSCKYGQGTKWCTASKRQSNSFEVYYKTGILYRIIQKNDNYKNIFNNFWHNLELDYLDIENLSMVSLHINRSDNTISMRDKLDNPYDKKMVGEFLDTLPANLYESIKNYHKLKNRQYVENVMDTKRII